MKVEIVSLGSEPLEDVQRDLRPELARLLADVISEKLKTGEIVVGPDNRLTFSGEGAGDDDR